MSRYGVSIYGLSVYGSDSAVSYAANNFTATSTGYGTIFLKWDSPVGKWSMIKLVRNNYGFPIDYQDGTELDIKNNNSYVAYKETDPTTYTDTNLATNAFYYYSLFVFERTNYTWIRISNVIGLSVKNYNFSNKLIEYLPDIYKINSDSQYSKSNTVINVSSIDENPTLQTFLQMFGFQLDKYYTLTNLLYKRYDTTKLHGLLLPSLIQQVGLEYEPEIGYQQARILIRDSTNIYKEKGSINGIREFLKAFTGWASPTIFNVPNPTIDGISVSLNKMLDYNDSSFEESVGHWVSDSANAATLSCLKVQKIKTVQLTSNVLTLTIGPHQYAVNNKIYVFGFSQPLFNQTTAVTITSVSSTTISFALTGSDYPSSTALNPVTLEFPTVAPYPNPWSEVTSPTNYPNLQKGILAIKNVSATAGTIKVLCGSTAPITKGIPVTGSLSYTYSVYTVNSTTTRNVTLEINWYDRFGVFISSISGSALASGTGSFSARPFVTGTAPSNAVYAVPTMSVAAAAGSASNEYQYFDCAEFEQASATSPFEEARQLKFTFRGNRVNELANPHFASPVAPWTITGAVNSVDNSTREPEAVVWDVAYKSLTANVARIETLYTHDYKPGQTIVISGVNSTFNGVYTITAVGERNGTVNYPYIEYAKTASNVTRSTSTGTIWLSGNALKLTASSTGTVTVKSWDGATNSQKMAIHYPLVPYTFSIYAQLSSGTGEAVTPYITWYDSSNTLLSSTVGSTITTSETSPNWKRISVTGTAPATAYSAVVTVEWAAANGEILYFDSALFEKSPQADPYFDGSSGYGSTPDYVWETTANSSRSHYYKNRYAIQTRTANATFKDNLPLGTTVAIYLAQPKT